MYTVHTQSFNGSWSSEEFETREQAAEYIASLDAVQTIEIEGVEFEDAIPSWDDVLAWVKA